MGELNRIEIAADKDTGPSLEEEAAKLDAAAEEAAKAEDEANNLGSDNENDEGNEGEQKGDERPSWLPEKFKTPEDLAKSYAELEKKLGQSKKTETPPEGEAEEAAKNAVEAAGLDFNNLSDKYAENGALDDDDYAALEKAGINRSLVDQFIRGQELQAEKIENSVYQVAGGAEGYQSMIAWAGENLDEAEINVFNEAVASGDMTKTVSAVRGLHARYAAEAEVEPQRRVNAGKTAGAGEVYESIAQLQADMSDPRYATDSAFRAKVASKLDRSDIM